MTECVRANLHSDVTCYICYEIIESHGSYAFLSNCDHVFCLTCIKEWWVALRSKTRKILTCPMCRIVSPTVCPSSKFISSKEEKKKAVEEHSKKIKGSYYLADGTRMYLYARPPAKRTKFQRLSKDGRVEKAKKKRFDSELWKMFPLYYQQFQNVVVKGQLVMWPAPF